MHGRVGVGTLASPIAGESCRSRALSRDHFEKGDITPVLSPCYARDHAAIQTKQAIQVLQAIQVRQVRQTSLEVHSIPG